VLSTLAWIKDGLADWCGLERGRQSVLGARACAEQEEEKANAVSCEFEHADGARLPELGGARPLDAVT